MTDMFSLEPWQEAINACRHAWLKAKREFDQQETINYDPFPIRLDRLLPITEEQALKIITQMQIWADKMNVQTENENKTEIDKEDFFDLLAE